MDTPEGFFQAGKLKEAIQSATQLVKTRPSDVQPRSVLCELLCFAGELERADQQLDTIIQLDETAAQGASLLRHLIRSEYARREVFEEGRVPSFLTEPTPAQQSRLKALLCLREGNPDEAEQSIREAEGLETEVQGEVNGAAVAGFRDLDDLLGPIIEVFTATGKYYWIGVDQIVSLDLNPIEHLSDMLWRGGRIITRGDVTGRGSGVLRGSTRRRTKAEIRP
jgi:type VI secretion system protein ImpE